MLLGEPNTAPSSASVGPPDATVSNAASASSSHHRYSSSHGAASSSTPTIAGTTTTTTTTSTTAVNTTTPATEPINNNSTNDSNNNSFDGGFDILHATSAALIDGVGEILLESDFENAMKVLTSWVPIMDEELFMKVVKAEWKQRRRR